MNFKKVSLTDFRIHFHAHIKSVEKGDLTLQITRNGKVVAQVCPPSYEPSLRSIPSPTL